MCPHCDSVDIEPTETRLELEGRNHWILILVIHCNQCGADAKLNYNYDRYKKRFQQVSSTLFEEIPCTEEAYD